MGFASQLTDFPDKLDAVGANIYSIPGWFYVLDTTYEVGAGTLHYIPIFVSRPTTYTGIAANVTISAAGSARMGIYQWVNGRPAGLVLDAGAVDTGSTGDKEIAITQTLSRGWYFLAIITSASPTMKTMDSASSVSLPMEGYFAAIGILTRVALIVGGRGADVAGGLVTPAPTPEDDRSIGSFPLVWLKEA